MLNCPMFHAVHPSLFAPAAHLQHLLSLRGHRQPTGNISVVISFRRYVTYYNMRSYHSIKELTPQL